MADAFFIVSTAFFALFTIFLFVSVVITSLRMKRSKQLLDNAMKEYELFYQEETPDPGPLPDNIIEFSARQKKVNENDSSD
jgi:hypothetical protein